MGANSSKVSRVSASSQASSQKLEMGFNLSVVSFGSKEGDYDVDERIKYYAESGTTVVVNKVLWYMSDLGGATAGLAHEFLVLDLLPFAEYSTSVFIRVEKNRVLKGETTKEGEKRKPGGWISIKYVNPAELGKGVKVKGKVDLSGCGEILMKDLVENLKDHSLRYSLWKHSCWKYAYDALMKLLKLLEGLSDTSYECKEKIRHARRQLPPPKLPLYILCGGAIAFLFSAGILSNYSVVVNGTFQCLKAVANFLMGLAVGVPGLADSSLKMNLGKRKFAKTFLINPLIKSRYIILVGALAFSTFVVVTETVEMAKNHSVGTSAS